MNTVKDQKKRGKNTHNADEEDQEEDGKSPPKDRNFPSILQCTLQVFHLKHTRNIISASIHQLPQQKLRMNTYGCFPAHFKL